MLRAADGQNTNFKSDRLYSVVPAEVQREHLYHYRAELYLWHASPVRARIEARAMLHLFRCVLCTIVIQPHSEYLVAAPGIGWIA